MNNFIAWSPGVTLDQIERQVIEKAFSFYRRNKTATAQALGISVRTLDNKFEKYGNDDKSRVEHESHERQKRADYLNRSRGITSGGAAIVSGPTAATPANDAPRPQTPTGVRVEPAPNAAPQYGMPMSQRPQVQTVLPAQATAGGNGKRR